MLNDLDPAGVAMRKRGAIRRRVYYSAGPNESWCYDGHDKLSEWNLYIYGCRDAFSGKWIWLQVSWIAKDPRVLCCYFLKAILRHKVVPFSTRSDCGTETVEAVSYQYKLHEILGTNLDIKTTHKYVRSVHNIKIESAWAVFRKSIGHSLELLLESGVKEGIYNPNNLLQRYIFWFLFLPFIQETLDTYAELADNKPRQISKIGHILPRAAPNLVYYNPTTYEAEDCGFKYDCDVQYFIENAIDQAKADPEIAQFAPSDFLEAAAIVMTQIGNPALTYNNIWDIFQKVRQQFENNFLLINVN